jgi:predicted PurR-regulated permease PerM
VYGTHRRSGGLPLQTIAMVAFGAIAAIALYASQTAGAYLVAGGLFAHAAWDVYHHSVNKVVSRSMAEFCCILDISLAVAIIIATAGS